MEKRVLKTFVGFLRTDADDIRRSHPSWWMHQLLLTQSTTKAIREKNPTVLTRQKKILRVHKEIVRDVKDLLAGKRISEIELKLNYWRPKTLLRIVRDGDELPGPFHTVYDRRVVLGGQTYRVGKSNEVDTTEREIAYGLLRDMIESGEFKRLSMCSRSGCGKIAFHKTKKPKFCSDKCRYTSNNQSLERREKRRKGGEWYR